MFIKTIGQETGSAYSRCNKGFEERTIRRMMQFAQVFPDFQIVSTVLSKLSWSHFLIVMTLKDELQR